MWHTHPLGQTLIVTSELGWAQCEGGPIEEIRPGDVIWFPPGEKHWHGATATIAMTLIAITESLNGRMSTGWKRSATSSIEMTGANENTAAWLSEELSKITSSDDLHVSPFREDGKTRGTPTWIWSVVVDFMCEPTTADNRAGIRRP